MKNERFEELLAGLLEGTLSEKDRDEFIGAVEADARRAERLRDLLAFEPLLADMASGKGREDAFLNRIQAVIGKEMSSEQFIQSVVSRATQKPEEADARPEIAFGSGISRFAQGKRHSDKSLRARKTSARAAEIEGRRRQGRFLWGSLLAAALLAGVTIYYAFFTRGGLADEPVALGQVIYVTKLTKETQSRLHLVRADGRKSALTAGDELFRGDRIETGSVNSIKDQLGNQQTDRPAMAGIRFAGAELDLADKTRIAFIEARHLKLEEGLLRLEAKGDFADAQIETDFGIVALRNGADVAFDLMTNNEFSRLRMERGESSIKTAKDREATASAFQEILALKDGTLKSTPIGRADLWLRKEASTRKVARFNWIGQKSHIAVAEVSEEGLVTLRAVKAGTVSGSQDWPVAACEKRFNGDQPIRVAGKVLRSGPSCNPYIEFTSVNTNLRLRMHDAMYASLEARQPGATHFVALAKPLKLDPQKEHVFRMELNGNECSCYVNETRIFEGSHRLKWPVGKPIILALKAELPHRIEKSGALAVFSELDVQGTPVNDIPDTQ